ncbi:unnamed protein product [Microthlaspi erraticum]|uniref:Cytochrome P450 n=1 Tax=Microthlaspi erraticum TaxID=1685480 RepID=A0A6D2J4M6_9BRAS|nr:unnamed protein product [Microthlaspi erraticum]
MLLPPQEISRRSYSQELAVPRMLPGMLVQIPRIFDWTVDGPEFKKIFDVLGDGILAADLELWEDLRKSSHALFHHQDIEKLSVSSNTSKLKEGLVHFLDNASEKNIIIDLQDVLQRFMFDTSSILMTGYDPMSLSVEMPEVEFGEAADLGEEAIFYRHFKPVILWKFQNWIGVGLRRRCELL